MVVAKLGLNYFGLFIKIGSFRQTQVYVVVVISECRCDQLGTEECDSQSGICRCKPGVIGATCDQCEVTYHNQPETPVSGQIWTCWRK